MLGLQYLTLSAPTTSWSSDHILLFDTDQERFGGHNRLSSGYGQRYCTLPGQWQNRPYSVSLYLPCRTALILIPEENISPAMVQERQIPIPPIQQAGKAKAASESPAP